MKKYLKWIPIVGLNIAHENCDRMVKDTSVEDMIAYIWQILCIIIGIFIIIGLGS